MTQEHGYTVVRAFPGFDVRRYPPAVLLQVQVSGDFRHAARRGAGVLFRYLGGDNLAARTLLPASPVLQEQAGESTHLVSMILPATDPAEVPAPTDESVLLKALPAHEAAAVRFPGGWRTSRFTEHGRELLAAVNSHGLEALGAVYFARFDPFWSPRLRSLNEALVRVTSA